MNNARQLNETPKERLERVARSSRPFWREPRGRNYLIALALLLLLACLVAIGIVGGTLGSSVAAEHARRIMEWVWPPEG